MRSVFRISGIMLFIVAILLFHSCKKKEVPTLTTTEITNITGNSFTSGGTITSEGSGTVIARGVCWSTQITPTINDNKTQDGDGAGTFISNISGLSGGTSYYVRAYATNREGTSYGSELIFKTYTVTDIDGIGYNSVTIGTQTWMTENLKTTNFNDGTPIPFITNEEEWSLLSTPGYSCFNNDPGVYKSTYGALYNWYAVSTGILCPTGWHVPSDAEWTTLTTYLGGENVAGGKLKERGTDHWLSPNTGATNETGFTALPGGYRRLYGSFINFGEHSDLWSSTENDPGGASAWERSISTWSTNFYRGSYNKQGGFSVRCLKDF